MWEINLQHITEILSTIFISGYNKKKSTIPTLQFPCEKLIYNILKRCFIQKIPTFPTKNINNFNITLQLTFGGRRRRLAAPRRPRYPPPSA
jgi:hypothetical protein